MTIKFDYSDKATWETFQNGKTVCVFQCESPLVQKWLKKIKPENLWELAAVVSAVRPGPLLAQMTETYVHNKFFPDKVEKFNHPTIDAILEPTYNVILFQEQIMDLGKKVAWIDLPENERLIQADVLRKAIGKKSQKAILEIGQKFVEGCLRNQISQEIADRLFDLIKKSGRYVFNLSHAVSYAKVAFETAYVKTHYAGDTFISWMNAANECQKPLEELDKLVQDSKAWGFTVIGPNVNSRNIKFEKVAPEQIQYGLGYIKMAGNGITNVIQTLPKITTWQQIMRLGLTNDIVPKLRSPVIEAMICSGCFRDVNVFRHHLLDVYNILSNIKERELIYALKQIDSIGIKDIPKLIEDIANNISTKGRKQVMLSEAQILKSALNTPESILWIEEQEIKYLGCVLSPCETQKYEHVSSHNCYECNNISDYEDIAHINLIGRIDSVFIREIKTGKNKGKPMAQISIRDSSGRINNLPVFSETYLKCSADITEKNIVELVMSHRAHKGFMVKSIRLV